MAVRRPTAINTNNFPRGRDPMGSSCPALNEEVLLADNKWIPAKDLKIGDEVATHLGSNKVTHIDFLKDRVKKQVVFFDNDQEESIVTSDSHPYYVQNEEGFVEVKDLKVGDQVGNFKVKEIKDADKGSVVHISIDKAQTYYLKAGNKKVLSHNKRPPSRPRPNFEELLASRPGLKRVEKQGGGFGGFGNLREAIRRLKEERDMGMLKKRRMPRMEGSIGRLPGMGMIGTTQPIPERMPTNPSSYYNPTIFGQPIGNFDFGNMPNFSIDDIMEMPQAPTQMPMPQDLPEVAPVGMMPQKRMGGMQDMEPRMMMSGGDEVFMDSSPEQMAFSIGVEIENLYKDYEEAVQSGDDQRAMMLNEQINDLEARRIEMMNQSRPQLAEGGEPFPDLSGDGKTTRKDILIGQGVKFKAEGGEMMMEGNEMMAPGGDDIEASLMEVQGMQPEMQALDQYVQMVIQMIQAGASEAEVIESLRQAGLDDEDIAALFEAVMETMQGGMGQGEIDQELAQLS